MSSQLVTMPLLIGYAVSSMSRAAVHSSPIMISCVRKRYRSQHTAAACTRHAAIPARTFSCTFWIFSSERRMGRPTIEGKMCAGKLSPAKPHFTNCENSSPWSRGGYRGLWAVGAYPCAVVAYNWRLVHGSRRHRRVAAARARTRRSARGEDFAAKGGGLKADSNSSHDELRYYGTPRTLERAASAL